MRPRKKDRHLPNCVFLRSGSYYYVKRGKWENIGKTLEEALKAYASRVASTGDDMPALLERYYNSLTVAPNTKLSYATAKGHLSKILEEFKPSQVTARHVTNIMDEYKSKPGTANIMRSFLIGALQMGIRDDLVTTNVARETRPFKLKARDRYLTDEEFITIRNHANAHLRLIMDVCYMTAQRIGDVLAIKHADVSDQGITFIQSKTKHRMMVAMTPELRDVVKQAKALHTSVKGMTLFHNRMGRPYLYDYVRSWWNTACTEAGVENANIHDIRAKAATDAHKQGMDSKALLGHISESSHNKYLRSKDTPVAQALSLSIGARQNRF